MAAFVRFKVRTILFLFLLLNYYGFKKTNSLLKIIGLPAN
jgi:hypothetical protein